MNEQQPSQIQISVTHEGATIHTNLGPGIIISSFLPENMVKDIYSRLMFEQKDQASKDQDIIRAMRNGRIK